MKLCKKIIFAALCAVMLLSLCGTGLAQTSNSDVIQCTRGMMLTADFTASASDAVSVAQRKYVVCADSYCIMKLQGGFADIGELTQFDIGESLFLKEGVIAFQAGGSELQMETATQKAYIHPDAKLAVRVDDYGNAFNYCLEGSVKLYSKLDDDSMTINAGEYIAVTVKRGFRKLKLITIDDITDMGVSFSASGAVFCDVTEPESIGEISSDFKHDGKIADIDTNKAYWLEHSENGYISHLIYAGCNANEAIMCIYDSELNLVGSSHKDKSALRPNVKLESEKNSRYIVCVYNSKAANLELMQEKTMSLVDRAVGIVKRFAIPFLFAIVAFGIYCLADTKSKKKPRF